MGEPGSGKSTTARIILALDEPDRGAVQFAGRSWTTLAERERRPRRRSIWMIYQDRLGSFGPHWTVGRIICDSLSSDVETRSKRQERHRASRYDGTIPGFARPRTARALGRSAPSPQSCCNGP
ncbi:ATP-binding cassette domain-containing protein [Bradyrhizobium sacchari]|uniref:ATP-binding cassette domain-containing protein n=1 Tax=Bradyrhizobium sacchari TaxID=1399419 RepID=UPI001FD9CF72|nr:ATP-binding cassette domain-containing protein [Bradyrhizobium sacchari]